MGKHFSHDLLTEEALWFVRANRDRPFFLYVPYAVPHLAIQVEEDSLAESRGTWPDPPYEGGRAYLPHPAHRLVPGLFSLSYRPVNGASVPFRRMI